MADDPGRSDEQTAVAEAAEPAAEAVDPTAVQPFTRAMIERYLRAHDLKYRQDNDGDFIVPYQRSEVSGREVTIYLGAEGASGQIYSLRAWTDLVIDQASRERALRFCNTWNTDTRWPKALVKPRPADETTAVLMLEEDFRLDQGIHQALFDEFTTSFIHATFEFWGRASAEARLGAADAPASGGPRRPSGDGEDVLALCGINLTEQAARGRLGRAERRAALVEQVLARLAAPDGSGVLLVGPDDVGKTTLIHEVVERLRSGPAPAELAGRTVWALNGDTLIAGMIYVGAWQQRLQRLVVQAREERPVLVLADPNDLIDAGRASDSANNIARFLLPSIESGDLTVLCETTPEGYATALRREPSFINAFYRLDVPETSETDTLAILQAAARRLEGAGGPRIDASATQAALELTRRFLPYRAFPGKAVACLKAMVAEQPPASGEDGAAAPGLTLGRADVIASFTRATGLPAFLLADEMPMPTEAVWTFFGDRILGQTEAVAAMVDLITVLKAGLNSPSKPLGTFFFVGPTGVGKTETPYVLAEFLFGQRERLLRFDMSEYAAGDALARLIGTAWRHDGAGELTRRVREQPFCVVLLDEIEKAHPDVFDALLGVLGEGRLTDASGRTTDFRNAIIIMTSNLGAGRREMSAIGFAPGSREDESAATLRDHFMQEMEAFFRPEFVNRIDRGVVFRPLSPEAMRRITRRELGKLLVREGIVRRRLLVEIDEAVIDLLLAEGFHARYGARPLQRTIERRVIVPLARLLVEQPADARHLLHFGARDGAIHLSLTALDVADEAAVEAPPEGRPEADRAAVTRTVEALLAAVVAEQTGPVARRLRDEVSALLASTNEPTFWDDPAAARAVFSRIHDLDQVVKRLDALVERAEGLVERGRRLPSRGDRTGLLALGRAAQQVAGEFATVQLEVIGLSAAGAAAGRRVVVRVTPVGQESEAWARQVAAMYTAWARRKGFETRPVAGGSEGGAREAPSGVLIAGPGVAGLLRGEVGLHKLTRGAAEERQRLVARVLVLPLPPDLDATDGAALAAAVQRLSAAALATADGARDSIVRLYSQGRHRAVRDPRTGTRLTDLPAVLEEGHLDAFLLAWLRRQG